MTLICNCDLIVVVTAMGKPTHVVRRRATAGLAVSLLVLATSAIARGENPPAAPGASQPVVPPVAPVPNTPAAPVPSHENPTPSTPPVVAPAAPPAVAPVTPAAPSPCRGTLDGHVIDDVSHEPLIEATVTVGTLAPRTTDATGHFLITGLCPGAVVVEAGRIDYISQTRTLTIGDGTSTSSLEMELRVANVETIEVKGHAPPPTDMRSTASISGAALEQTRGKALAEALADVPGVTLLRSGTGMAKPIVRGQFGRRLLLLVDGMRHRAQEWGLDHAPEIDPFIADKIEVVRGAAGVQYGPDAIGGAVLVSPPRLLTAPGYAGEAHLIGYNNGLGGVVAARLRAVPQALPKLAYMVEGSAKRLASPNTPDYPINNTGAAEWNLGATVGYRQARSTYELSYRHYQAKLGICSCLRIDSIDDFYAQLGQRRPQGVELYKSDFSIERPYQQVGHDMVLARGHWDSAQWGTLTATYGYQHNLRREFEQARQATTDAQFNFRLQTHELNVTLAPNPIHVSDHWHLHSTYGLTGVAQDHGYHGLPLIPDYTAFAGSVFALQRLIGHDLELEAGVRYDGLTRTASIERADFLRLVRSGQLQLDACGGMAASEASVACRSRYHTVSASLGVLRRLSDAWDVKADLSTATRPPNPDEQYLNGTSPTFPVLGYGKPTIAAETTFSGSLTTSYHSGKFTGEASGFVNRINNYIYFAPAIDGDGKPIFDVLIRGTFPRFVTRSVDAIFYGADGGAEYRPHAAITLAGQASLVRARNVTDQSYLVFVPPNQYRAAVTYRPPSWGRWHSNRATVSGTLVQQQSRYDVAADLAKPPAGYFLLGAEFGSETKVGNQVVKVALAGNNLLGARYRDYTSLLRYFVDQPTWQLALRISIAFGTPAS